MSETLRRVAFFGLAGAALLATPAYALNPEPPDIIAADLSRTVVCPTQITVNGAPLKVTCGNEAFVQFNGHRVYGYTAVFSRWGYRCPSGQWMEITYPVSISDVLYHESATKNWTLSLHCPGDNAFNNDLKRSELRMDLYRKSWAHNGGRYYSYTISH